MNEQLYVKVSQQTVGRILEKGVLRAYAIIERLFAILPFEGTWNLQKIILRRMMTFGRKYYGLMKHN